jgi:hypothetical protein
MSNIPSILDDAKFRHLLLEQNQLIESSLVGIAGFNLPPYDEVDLSNYVAADKPGTIVLKSGGATVATLTLSYDGSNNLTSIVRS